MKKEKIGFIGTGLIGSGLAVNALLRGHPATLCDLVLVEESQARVKQIMAIMIEAGACTQEQADEAYARASFTNDIAECVRDAVFVQESVPEWLDVKKETFRKIQEISGPSLVIGSSTSALMPTSLQEGALYPEQILVGHPYNPSYLLPLIEIVGGEKTTEDNIQYAKKIYTSMGKQAAICRKEVFGYLAQNINFAIRDMAKQLVVDGVGTAEDVDKALMYGPGMRLPITGQLLTLSLGLDGGWREMSRRYLGKEPPPEDLMLADQIDEAIANRPEAIGNTVETVAKFRDKMLVEMLRIQGLL